MWVLERVCVRALWLGLSARLLDLHPNPTGSLIQLDEPEPVTKPKARPSNLANSTANPTADPTAIMAQRQPKWLKSFAKVSDTKPAPTPTHKF